MRLAALLFLSLSTCINFVHAQQKLSDGSDGGSIVANADAILELASKNKGLLHARVELERADLPAPLSAHIGGMMVFNTKSKNDVVVGIYYNDGSKWVLASAGGTNGGNETLTTLVDGAHTTVEGTTTSNQAIWKVNVATANGTSPGVVKEAATNPTVRINPDGELAVDFNTLNYIVETDVDYTPLMSDAIILGDASSGDVTITLPAPTTSNKGKKYTIKKEDPNEDGYVNVIGNINGVIAGLYTALPYSGWDLISDGASWRIINKF